MQNLYSCLTGLLGRPEADPAFAEVVAELEDPPKLLRDKKHHRVHDFANSGFSLTSGENGFSSTFLHISTAATESGSTKPFIGQLPFGVCASDTRQDVECKIGKKPDRAQVVPSRRSDAQDYWDDYDCGAFVLRFMFCSETAGISAVSVSLRKEVSHLQESSSR